MGKGSVTEHTQSFSGSLFRSAFEPKTGASIFAYYYKQWDDYQMSYHTHDSTEIMYIITGMCRVDVMMADGGSEQAVLKRTVHPAGRRGSPSAVSAGWRAVPDAQR